jgi:hypothetical protein
MPQPKGQPLHIYPIKDVYIPGRRAAEQDVTEAEWLVINEYQPPAFVYDPLPEEAPAPKEGKD